MNFCARQISMCLTWVSINRTFIFMTCIVIFTQNETIVFNYIPTAFLIKLKASQLGHLVNSKHDTSNSIGVDNPAKL